MTRIAISGIRGRMGQALVRLAADRDDMQVIGGIGRASATDTDVPIVAIGNADDIIQRADVLIDFSSSTATDALIDRAGAALAGRALVVGTTGLSSETQERLDALAGDTAVLRAANFSVGINLLMGLTERLATVLDAATFDIEIVEAHHRRKMDAPSGTALALGEAAARGRDAGLDTIRRDGRSGDTGARTEGEIGFHAVRAGGITGEHRVLFAAERELIELRHEALDRSVFAHGALEAAHWITGRPPGEYTMRDVLGI